MGFRTSTSPRCCRSSTSARRGARRSCCTSATARACAHIQAGASVASTMGFTAARRAADGHALRRARPRRDALPAWTNVGWTRAPSRSWSITSRGCSACQAFPATCARSWPRASRGPGSRSTSSAIAFGARWARSPLHSAGWTRSCSPAASARTRPSFGSGCAATRPGSALSLTRAANARAGPRISTARSRVAAFVIPTNEELMIAQHTRDVLARG